MKKKPGEEEKKVFKPNICPRCNDKNSPDSKFCNRCGAVVDLKTTIQLDESRRKLDKLFEKLTEDPEKLGKLLALVKAL